MVTAIGIKSEKKALGYAAQEVKGEDITGVQQSNVVNALGSRIAGVNVTSSAGTPGASSLAPNRACRPRQIPRKGRSLRR